MKLWDKGHKIICEVCNDHIATFSRDIFEGNAIAAELFTDEGQGPWISNEPAECRKCGMQWIPKLCLDSINIAMKQEK